MNTGVIQQAMEAGRRGQLDEARRLIRTQLDPLPDAAEHCAQLGSLCGQFGLREESITLLRRASELAPDSARWAAAYGVALRQAGLHADAIDQFRTSLALDDSLLEARLGLANSLCDLGQSDRAIHEFQQYIERSPDDARAHQALGALELAQGQVQAAMGRFRRALEIDPGLVRAHAGLGQAALVLGRPDVALSHCQEVLRLAPNDADAHVRLGGVLNILERFDEAEASFREAVRLAPNNAQFHVALGRMLRARRKPEESEASYRKALAIRPALTEARFELASLLERCHRLEEAKQEASQIVDSNPLHERAVTLLAGLERRSGELEKAKVRLEQLIARASPGGLNGTAQVELGHVYDALGEFDHAFGAISKGQARLLEQPAARQYSLRVDLDLIERINDWLRTGGGQTWPTTPPEDGIEAPIFFVGYPRSGTTLTEQILAAHPNLVAADERAMLARCMRKLYELRSTSKSFPDVLDELTEREITLIRHEYWKQAREFLGEQSLEGKRLVDKLPLNIMKLPFVRRFFPEAKVLVALRDPRDCCISCFFQQFRPNHSMIHYHRLETTANHYAAVMGCWLLQREHLGLNWLETRYEDLVIDLEGCARRLLEFLEEPWDDSMLTFYEGTKKKFISTPSYAGVREPVYTRASQRWRRYESHLRPVMAELEPFIKTFGYHVDSNADAASTL